MCTSYNEVLQVWWLQSLPLENEDVLQVGLMQRMILARSELQLLPRAVVVVIPVHDADRAGGLEEREEDFGWESLLAWQTRSSCSSSQRLFA